MKWLIRAIGWTKERAMRSAHSWFELFFLFLQQNNWALVVRSESDGSTVLNSAVTLEDYSLQQDTLIIW
jgi:hypothetical protein